MACATKSASIVKNTRGSEKKWTEMLSSNHRHDLQLPIELAKCDIQSKRIFLYHERHKTRTQRQQAYQHEQWNKIDVLFRKHLNEQLKPVTLSVKPPSTPKSLPLKRSFTPKFQPESVLSTHSSARHIPFLDAAQRFITHSPECVGNEAEFNRKQNEQKHYLRLVLDKEQERTKLAASRFSQQIYDETNSEDLNHNRVY
jgi:hypothetical protein